MMLDTEHLFFVESNAEEIGRRAQDVPEESGYHHHDEGDPQRSARTCKRALYIFREMRTREERNDAMRTSAWDCTTRAWVLKLENPEGSATAGAWLRRC